jgi:hypothetical protein
LCQAFFTEEACVVIFNINTLSARKISFSESPILIEALYFRTGVFTAKKNQETISILIDLYLKTQPMGIWGKNRNRIKKNLTSEKKIHISETISGSINHSG